MKVDKNVSVQGIEMRKMLILQDEKRKNNQENWRVKIFKWYISLIGVEF